MIRKKTRVEILVSDKTNFKAKISYWKKKSIRYICILIKRTTIQQVPYNAYHKHIGTWPCRLKVYQVITNQTVKFFCFFVFLGVFWPCHTACRIFVPQPGIGPGHPAVKALSPNHRTSREFPEERSLSQQL